MKKILAAILLLLLMLILLFSMASCTKSGNNSSPSDAPASSSIASDTSEPAEDIIPAIDLNANGYAKPGIVAQCEGFTFVTDYYAVYKIDDNTGETSKIFSSDDLLLAILQYADYIFIQTSDSRVFVTDLNGKVVGTLNNVNLILISDSYIYYESFWGIYRRKLYTGDAEYIVDWFEETGGMNNIGYWTKYLGYFDSKIYFQENYKIYSLTKDAEKAYVCDGRFMSLDESKLIVIRGYTLYSIDLNTGDEREIGSNPNSSDMLFLVDFIGEYGGEEYYLLHDKIYVDKEILTDNEGVPFEFIVTAVAVNEWIYMDCLNEDIEFLRYNIETKQKEPISELGRSATFYQYNDCLYYIDSSEQGLFRLDLSDNSCKKIYNGTMYVFENLI